MTSGSYLQVLGELTSACVESVGRRDLPTPNF